MPDKLDEQREIEERMSKSKIPETKKEIEKEEQELIEAEEKEPDSEKLITVEEHKEALEETTEPDVDAEPLEKGKIRGMALNSIADYFKLDRKQLADLPKETLIHLHQKARLGMSFEREMGIGERSVEANTLRVMTLVATDKKDLKLLIKKSLPQYNVPDKEE